MLLTTKDIKRKVQNLILTSPYSSQLNSYLDNMYHFTNQITFPGEYFYSDSEGYHHVSVQERGNKVNIQNTLDLDSIISEILWNLSFNVSLVISKRDTENFRSNLLNNIVSIIEPLGDIYVDFARKKILDSLE